jgi:hypothetical protein
VEEYTNELRSRLAAVRRRWFTLAALRTAARALGAAALPILVALAIELVVRPEGAALMIVAAGAVAASLALAALAIRRMQPRPDDRHVARFIEERAAQLPGGEALDDALVSAVEVCEGPVEPAREPFIPLIVGGALRRLRVLLPGQIVETGAIRTAALQAAGSAAALGLVLVLGAPALGRALDTAHVRFFPGSIDVRVEPGDTRVPAGSALRIRAVVTGRETVLSRFPPSLVVSAGGDERTVHMTREGSAFAYDFESVDRSFTYRVSAGRAASDEYTVTALFPPRVRQIDLRYEYPAFTGLAPRDDEDGGDIYGPAGTAVRVRVHTDKPIADGQLALGTTPLAMRRAGDRLLEADLVLKADGSYRISLADEDGLRADDHTEYYIRLMDDRPPDVRILRPSADQSITPLEEVTIEARADDDYGIARFELVFSVGGGEERVVPFTQTTGTAVQKVGRRILAAEELGVKPGDVIAYYARAWDVGRGKRPTLAQSDIYFLEVKPFSEEFVLAESQGGAGGGASGAQIESLIAAQKEIISATWNLERRSQHGVSEADLQRVVEAQAELRKRTEALANQGDRGRIRMEAPFERIARGLMPGLAAQARQAPSNPVGAAIEAMGKALAELEASRTRDAIQHEMAALNGLLEAQAEVRRREVRRQSAGSGGGGWGNRNAQDLTALFDRELQRQQRTTYATRNSVQNREDRRDEEGAADRIRDLARRQEDLNRRQRELAAAELSAEERKRQLERLTREQAELREQAEALQKQMQGQQGQGGGQGQQQAGGVREASEQMRNAAGELQKENVESAAERGERAAEHLRRLEQQMRGQEGAAGQRSAAELEVEARQIAQEQRRIAAEAERLEQSQGDTAGARDRLADEKERLAGRVDELQRAAREQAQREGATAGGAAEAAREIEKQRIGQQMRDAARRMREGTGRQGAEAEQQLARALDQVAERLGGRTSDEARRLSEQLDQVNRIRDRLNRLEQQMREAAAREQAGGGEGRETGERSEIERLREEYDRELKRAQEALGRLQQGSSGGAGATPEHHEFATSAPGTESWKQDRSEWASLREGIDSGIARQEAAASDRLARTLSEERLSAGGSDRVPDAYQRLIARYYESLARSRR